MGGLGLGSLSSSSAAAPSGGIPSIVAYDAEGLKLVFAFEKPANNPQLLNVNVTATNTSAAVITDYVFQAAVPTVSARLC
jgi:hypothetical protein